MANFRGREFIWLAPKKRLIQTAFLGFLVVSTFLTQTPNTVYADSSGCATPGKDGLVTISAANTIVNTHYPGTGSVAIGDTSITVGAATPGGNPASIRGTVFNDVNGNTIRDGGEPALPGVRVDLLDASGTVIATAFTAADGSYSFVNLAPGLYSVRETDPAGFVSTTPNTVGVVLVSGAEAAIDFGDQLPSSPTIADPAVTKFSPASARIGDVIIFLVTVSNIGNIPGTGVVVTDTAPAFLDILSVSISPGSGFPVAISGTTITIDFGTLSPTDVYLVTIVTRVNALATPPGGVNNVLLTSTSPTDRPENDAASAPITITNPPGILPGTGFAPDRVSAIPAQPADRAYADLNNLSLDIPKLGVNIPIVGIPRAGNSWDLTWLGNEAGWLNGTAFPTWAGNSVITAHVYLASGLPGPFVNLNSLAWGDEIIVHLDGQQYVYQVREVRLVRPYDLSVLRHEDLPWLTLITCRGYDSSSDSYTWRVAVRAVLVAVQ